MANEGKLKSRTKKPARKNSGYDNTSRLEKSKANEMLIIETMVALLVKNKGAEVTFDQIAKATGLAERSIYRFFKNKEALHQETDRYLSSFLAAGVEQLNSLNVVGFGRNTYAVFDRNEPLVLAYVYSHFGEEARRIFRKQLNQFIIEKIKQEKGLQIEGENLKKVALITALINAKIWHDIKSDFGYSGVEMGDAVEWALQTLMDGLTPT